MSMAVVLVAAAALLGWWWPRWMVRIQPRIDARWVLVAWPAAQAMFTALWVAAVSVLVVPNHFGVHKPRSTDEPSAGGVGVMGAA